MKKRRLFTIICLLVLFGGTALHAYQQTKKDNQKQHNKNVITNEK